MRLMRGEWMRDLARNPQKRGFIWGAGAALAAYFLWPAVKEAVRPCAKGMIRGAMVAGDRFRYAMSSAREGVEDVIAEAQFERLRNTTEPDGTEPVDLHSDGSAARPLPGKREH